MFESFREKASNFGIVLPSQILFDGKIHRFNPANGTSKGDSGWYIARAEDDIGWASFGNWSDGVKEKWFSGQKIDAKTRKKIEKIYKDAEKEDQKKHKEAAKLANDLWEKATPASPDHPYLIAKSIQPHNARQIESGLIIPSYSDDAENPTLIAVQTISSDGSKKFTFGSKMAGAWSVIEGATETIIICEGWATAATIAEATGQKTYIAWNAGNMPSVAQYVRARHPDAEIVIAADQDAWDKKTGERTDKNAGQKKGVEAAASCGGILRTIPAVDDLLPNGKHATDFNDWAILNGIDSVKALLTKSEEKSNVIRLDRSDIPSAQELNKRMEINTALAEFNEKYAVVKIGGTARVADFEKLKNGEITFLKSNDFIVYAGNRFAYVESEGEEKPKRVSVAKKWLEWPKRRTYEKMVFVPTTKNLPENCYNFWRGWAVEPKENSGKYDLFFDHIKTNICSGDAETFRWIDGWLCDLFQNPCRKIGVALVLRSMEEGTGKGFFVNHIGKLIGKHFATYLHSDRIVGKFNAHLRDKLLIFMDEAIWAGDKVARGVLYGLITEPTITVEAKGMMPEPNVASYLRLVMASNHSWVAPAGPDARRFSVIDVDDKSKNNLEYFNAIEAQLLNGGYEALLWHYLNTPYDRDFIRMPLKTTALLEQKIAGLENEIAWFFEVLNYKKFGSFEPWGYLQTTPIKTEDFYVAYLAWAEKNSIRKPCTRIYLAKNINKTCGLTKANIPLISEWGGSERYYNLVSLDQYRDAFETRFGQKIDWEN